MKEWNRYTATKETAQTLRERVLVAVPLELPALKEDLLAFLNACASRLPSSDSVRRDRERRANKDQADAEKGGGDE